MSRRRTRLARHGQALRRVVEACQRRDLRDCEVPHGLVLEGATQGCAELVHCGVGARGGRHAEGIGQGVGHSGRGSVAQ